MDHLLELLKIIEGAVNADRPKVHAYVDQLAKKLAAEGNTRAADRLRRAVGGGRMTKMDITEAFPARRLPVDQESRLPLADEEHLQLGDVPLVLDVTAQENVDEFLGSVRATSRLLARGVDFNPSLLAFGPPGCGKTQLARFVASELELPLLTARTDSLISSFLGSTAKNLRSLCDHAVSRPCVLFLDEFDAVAKLRDDRYELGELKRVVVSLLQNIDALRSHTILIAATNHDHLLDPAIWRRFSYRVRMSLPSADARILLFREFLADFGDEKLAVDCALVSDGFSGADIRTVVEAAKRETVLRGEHVIGTTSLLRRILRVHRAKMPASDHSLGSDLRLARSISPDTFTYRRLAEMFEVSVGHIAKLLKQDEPAVTHA
jgi:SpoVK/Ycf46/Vps4 family AAA+-type ATPase